jgi:hypothetical protein
MGPRSPRKKRLFAALRLGFGLAILALVARSLPWSDRLLFTPPGGEPLAARGEIVGDWKADAIRFRPREPLAEPWPAEVRSAAAAESPLALRRTSDAAAPSYDWKPGMPRVFRDLDPLGLAEAMAFFAAGVVVIVTRWWRLLALAGCRTSWWNALRLTLLGLFFNHMMPGLTGGDVVKGVIAAKENPGRRADALVSVVVDRILGLVSLAVLATIVILVAGGEFTELRLPLIVFLGVALVTLLLYVNPFLRKALRLGALVERLPLGEKLRSLDRAAMLYVRHPLALALAFLLSIANHLAVVGGVVALGRAFGVGAADVSLAEFLVVVPVANIVSALPLAPGGWGLGEATYKVLFEMMGANGAMGVAVSVTFRLCQLVFGLFGGVFLLLPAGKAELREIEIDEAVA